MMSSLKRLWRDRRGNALVIAGAALPLIVGSAGLASDTIQWTLWKRQLQRAADSAAIAGVYARFASENLNASVATDLARNNHTFAALMSGYPQVTPLANTAVQMNGVQVGLAAQKVLGFSSVFLSAAPVINANATAAAVIDGEFCAMGLDPSTNPAIRIGGSSNTNLGCDAISNSTSPTESVDIDGNAYTFTADMVAGAGGMPSAITGVTQVVANHLAQPDPFAGKYSTDIPGGTGTCTNFNQKITDTVTTGTGQDRVVTYTMAPGCYDGFTTGPNTYVLSPGVYYLNNTNFVVNGGTTITGTGVTIILTGSDPGSLQFNGNSTLQLTAPVTGPYAKMLFIQAANADVGNVNTLNGTSTSFFDGGIYFPKGEIELSGNNGATTKCVMVVGFRLSFTGNSNLQNDTTGCVANQTANTWKVRLIG